MKKTDLKQLIKPLVKECIHEVLLEEGLLSTVVFEVAKGMQGNLIVEASRSKIAAQDDDEDMKRTMRESKRQMMERRQKLMDTVGTDAYNGVNIFEGTEPLTTAGSPNAPNQAPPVLGEDSRDPGVDISSLMGGASKIWKAMK